MGIPVEDFLFQGPFGPGPPGTLPAPSPQTGNGNNQMALGDLFRGIASGVSLVAEIAGDLGSFGRNLQGIPAAFRGTPAAMPGRASSLGPIPGAMVPGGQFDVRAPGRAAAAVPILNPFLRAGAAVASELVRAEVASPRPTFDFGGIDVPDAPTGASKRAFILRIVAAETFGRKTLTFRDFKRVVKDLGTAEAQGYMNLNDDAMLTVLANPPKRRGPFVSAKMVNRCATVIRRAKRLSFGMAKKLKI